MQAGFRESGAMNLTSENHPATPLVAVRSSGLGFDCLLGYVGENGHIFSSVSENYLKLLVQTANERFKTNTDRVSRFRSLLLSKYERASNKSPKELKNSQDVGKRQEGFMRQKQEMRAAGSGSTESSVDTGEDHLDLNTLFD
jgi:tRNA wybutosine-synthesizing protein 3